MSAYYMRKSTYQKDFNPRRFPQHDHDGMEGKTKFFPYPGRDNTRHNDLSKSYNSLERFDEKMLQRGRNETSLQYEDRLKHLRLSDGMKSMGLNHHHDDHDHHHYYHDNNDRHHDYHHGKPLTDRGPRPQHHHNQHSRGRDHHHDDHDHHRFNYDYNDRHYDHHHGEPLTDRHHHNQRARRYDNMDMGISKEYMHDESLTERMHHQEHNSPRMHHKELNSPQMHHQEPNTPRGHNIQRMHHQDQNSQQMHHQEHNMHKDTRTRTKNGVYLLSRIPKTNTALRELKHYFQRNHRYVSTAGGELLGIPEQIFLKYGGTLGYPDWKDNKDGEAANVLAVLWFPNVQAANSWATSGPLLKADHLLDSTTNSLALLPINYRPRKDSYPTYLMIELRTKSVRGPDAIENFRQTIVDRMNSIFKGYPGDWCSSFVVDTHVNYEAMPELQLLEKWMDKTFVFLHNFQNKYDASKFLSHYVSRLPSVTYVLDNAYDLMMGPYVATIFDLK